MRSYNGNVSEDKILEGHFAASALRIRATGGPILILQDTTEFSFKHSAPEKVGLCCVVAWRVSWLTLLSREAPKASPAAVFTDTERHLLERTAPDSKQKLPRDLDFYIRIVARLGGYLDRTSDAPPGTTVIWRGLSRLADLVEGAHIAGTPQPGTYG